MDNQQSYPWVLAIDPWRCGFGFVFMEGPERLIDWGLCIVALKDHDQQCIARFQALLERHQPNTVILEDWRDPRCRRSQRVCNLLEQMATEAKRQKIKVQLITPQQVKRVLHVPGMTANKHARARLMAARYPELSPRLPPPRKPWMSEDSRMAIFDACTFAFTYYQQ
ncbi:hypothetical protein JW998_09420 [candidate division KSB1 bacterium]|nr:hypothetical protein [candidate division KSB1 bacterium]